MRLPLEAKNFGELNSPALSTRRNLRPALATGGFALAARYLNVFPDHEEDPQGQPEPALVAPSQEKAALI